MCSIELCSIDRKGKPIAVICHGPWLLVSAGLVRGRRLTSYHTIQDDIHNAGGKWQDAEVVRDSNWVSSRQPSDIPMFKSCEKHQRFAGHLSCVKKCPFVISDLPWIATPSP